MFLQKHGDIEKAEKIRSEILDTYDKSDRNKESSFYLSILLQVINDNLRNDLLEEAKSLLNKADKISRNKRKRIFGLISF